MQFLRTTHKAGPLVALGLAGLIGLAPRRIGWVAVPLTVIACWPLVTGRAIDQQVTWKRIPAAWTDAAQHVDAVAGDGRAVVLPGQLYAYYDWGGTIDPLLPSLASDRAFVRGNGTRLTDAAGREYLDCWAQYGVLALGHNPPAVVAAVAEALGAGTPAFLHPLPAGTPPTRLTFARWLVDRRSPTTARVIVNRVWQAYFGTGLVETPEDFGTQGEKPSHPELLDWLAVEFMDSGWSFKNLHKLIVMSDFYRLSSSSAGADPATVKADPENRYLWRRNPVRRLPRQRSFRWRRPRRSTGTTSVPKTPTETGCCTAGWSRPTSSSGIGCFATAIRCGRG